MEYYKTLAKLHRALKPNTYLEVGIREGESLQLATGKTKCIGIDPAYNMKYPYLADAILVKDTSDNFFKKAKYKNLFDNEKIDLAFIDGMHLFEYALRDFINIEKNSHKNGVIALHDCIPKDKKSAARERTTKFWTGDVWKVVKILEKYRPDLSITVLDSGPSGLGLITNLDPKSTVLEENYKNILLDFTDLEFSSKQKINITKELTYNFESLSRIDNVRTNKSPLFTKLIKKATNKPKLLGVLLCYNDGDILPDVIEHLIDNKHELIVWNHGSDDNTAAIVEKYKKHIIEYKYVPREFDFYNLYPAMSHNLIENYVMNYDWISWPDQDEILEGPDRKKSYYTHLKKVMSSNYDWVQFNNFNYWFTVSDDNKIISPTQRIKHYCLFPDVAPRIRSWRASSTNERIFNHNKPIGNKYPVVFNLRHYPMRSAEQMLRRLKKDRANIQKGSQNYHYNIMKTNQDKLQINESRLHLDLGKELDHDVIFDWNEIYRKKGE